MDKKVLDYGALPEEDNALPCPWCGGQDFSYFGDEEEMLCRESNLCLKKLRRCCAHRRKGMLQRFHNTYELVCDHCKTSLRHPRKRVLMRAAREQGWQILKDVHYCSECRFLLAGGIDKNHKTW